MLDRFGLSVRKACRILGINRTTYLYKGKGNDDSEILEKMKQILKLHPRAGSNSITMYLHKEGVVINHKRVERLYKENKMQLKNRKRGHKKYSVKKREEHILTETPGNWIAIDFVIDSVANKRPLKNLTVIDPVSKVAPKIVPAYAMQGEGVAQVLNDIWLEEPFSYLQTDNGPEFRSSAVQSWCRNHAVTQVFSRPGKPTDNCFIESFNRTFRDECLNENYFTSLSEAKEIIESWRIDYNENRPQKGLKELTPSQFKVRLKGMKNSP